MMAKQKLLIVIEALEMNGVLRSLLDFMKAMDKSRYDISLFCFDAYQPSFVKLPSYVKLLPEMPESYMSRAPLARIFGWALRHGAFWMLARRLLCSVFQKHSSRFSKQSLAACARPLKNEYDVAIAYSMGMTWRFIAEKVNARRKLMWLHTDPRARDHIGAWDFYKKYLAGASALVTVSCGIRDVVRCSNLKTRVVTIHSVVDQRQIIEKAVGGKFPPRDLGRIRLVTIGRYSSSKNQKLIPAIASFLRNAGMRFEWFVVGPLCELARRDAAEEIARYDIGNCLMYSGSMENPYALVRSADIVVQPSVYEGWGLTVSEALCLQRYCVVSDIPSFSEQIKDCCRGRIVQLNAKEFADAIIDCIQSRAYVNIPPYVCPYTSNLTCNEFEQTLKL